MKKNIAILAFVLCTLLTLTNVSFGKEIKVLGSFALTGSAGAMPEFGWGFVDGIDYINKNGGINGKPVKGLLEDMRYDVPTGVAIFTRYAASEPANELLMAAGSMTGIIKALIDKVNIEQKIPWVDASYSTEIFGPEGGPAKYPYYFSMGATYGDQMKVLLKWIKQDFKGQGNPKIALVYSPTEWGRDPLAMGRDFAKKTGVDIVAEEEVTFTATDVTTQVTNVRRSGAKYLIFHGYAGGTPVTPIFLKTAKQFLKDVTILGTHYTTVLSTFLSAGEAAEGMIGTACLPMTHDVDNPGVKLFRELAKQNKRESKDFWPYLQSLNYVLLMKEAMIRADKAGELTREGMKKALENLTWDFNGVFEGKSFSYKSHTIPMVRLYKAQAKENKWQPIGEWINVNEEFK